MRVVLEEERCANDVALDLAGIKLSRSAIGVIVVAAVLGALEAADIASLAKAIFDLRTFTAWGVGRKAVVLRVVVHINRVAELIVVNAELDRTLFSQGRIGEEVVAVFVPVRPLPKTIERRARISSLVERVAFLSLLVDVAEDVLTALLGQPAYTPAPLFVARIRVILMVGVRVGHVAVGIA